MTIIAFFIWKWWKLNRYTEGREHSYPPYPGPNPRQKDSLNLELKVEEGQYREDVAELQVEQEDMSTVGQERRCPGSTDVVRDRKRAYRRKENGVGTYVNSMLRVCFTVLGLLTIILSVVLDNSYNDQPLRFIPFGILAPFTIIFGFLASGWFPKWRK
ncbi:hypothetical protein KC19_11G081700 [Ceratodon purpureus]|uniref:Uncharacterized protein n=1 Tax=Ceratodon purpureus TaxID=3225 RepID=A0A8T0GCP0_CERPU|nr:hypothetical protein KC19_11G081700 [Ceratodon purpureus]